MLRRENNTNNSNNNNNNIILSNAAADDVTSDSDRNYLALNFPLILPLSQGFGDIEGTNE